MIRVKMLCVSKEQVSKAAFVVNMKATGADAEEESTFLGSPKGKLDIGPVTRDAADQFNVGDEYDVVLG